MRLLDGINDKEDELYTFDSVIATEDKDNALEALNDLREYWLNHLPLSVKDGLKIVKVLEKEHKALEIIKKKLPPLMRTLILIRNKYEQAFEIIKNKRVNTKALIEILEDEWTWEQYMDEEDDINTGGHQFSRDRLTREEYELLKEVLL